MRACDGFQHYWLLNKHQKRDYRYCDDCLIYALHLHGAYQGALLFICMLNTNTFCRRPIKYCFGIIMIHTMHATAADKLSGR